MRLALSIDSNVPVADIVGRISTPGNTSAISDAFDRLMPVVYRELRLMASRHLAREPRTGMLQTTVLVHEAYVRLVDQRRVDWQGRAHFFAVAARVMRRIVIDDARHRRRDKRGGGAVHVALDDADELMSGAGQQPDAVDVLGLDRALTRLEELDRRHAEELRRIGEALRKGTVTEEQAAVARGTLAAAHEDQRQTVIREGLDKELAWRADFNQRLLALQQEGETDSVRLVQLGTEQRLAALQEETRRVVASLVKDPVAAVAKGEIMNFLHDVERVTKEADGHLTEIMMAQDFHDLTGQVIARVVNLAATIEDQLVQLLIQTAPPSAQVVAEPPRSQHLQGPVVDPEHTPDVVTDQSQVDDLLASLGF